MSPFGTPATKSKRCTERWSKDLGRENIQVKRSRRRRELLSWWHFQLNNGVKYCRWLQSMFTPRVIFALLCNGIFHGLTFNLITTEFPNGNRVACGSRGSTEVISSSHGKHIEVHLSWKRAPGFTLIAVVVRRMDLFGLDLALHRLHEVARVVRFDNVLLSCRDHLTWRRTKEKNGFGK